MGNCSGYHAFTRYQNLNFIKKWTWHLCAVIHHCLSSVNSRLAPSVFDINVLTSHLNKQHSLQRLGFKSTRPESLRRKLIITSCRQRASRHAAPTVDNVTVCRPLATSSALNSRHAGWDVGLGVREHYVSCTGADTRRRSAGCLFTR